jgi:Kef-type K+ transport system membrane component KefB
MSDEAQLTAAKIAVWVASIGACYLLGRYKRQPVLATILGALLGPLGFLIVLMSSGKCPHCASSIPGGARVCPHCTRDLPPM